MSWSRRFDDPIALPDGGMLKTLRDAAAYIEQLPRQEAEQPHWQTAVRELLIAADRNGIVMLSRIAVLQALNHGAAPAPKPERKKRARTFRIIS